MRVLRRGKVLAELEKACTDVVAFRWSRAQEAPDLRWIGRFHERHPAALASVFLKALELCRAPGMVSVGQVSLDWTKVRANASRASRQKALRLCPVDREAAGPGR